MLCLPDDDLSDTDRSSCPNCLAKQRVRFLAAFCGHEVVRRLEVPGVDLVLLDEIEYVDCPGLLECRSLEIFVGEYDELSLLVLVALDDLVPRNSFAVSLTDALVLDGRKIFLVQEAKADVVGADCGLQLHRDIHEPECQ